MKVLLINVIPQRFREMIPPLGLLYISSHLRSQGHSVYLFDSNEIAWRLYKNLGVKTIFSSLLIPQINLAIKRIKPDIVGLGMTFSSTTNLIKQIAYSIRKNFKNIPIVVGGANTSSAPHLFEKMADFVVVGEGEFTLNEILNSRFKGKNKVIFSERIKNLDILPFPAIDMLDLDMYFKSTLKLPVRDIRGLTTWFPVITSRGCPYKCIFCSIHSSMGYEWRARSPENVIAELDILVNKYGVKDILFEDDNISFKPQRFCEICEQIVKNELKIRWFVPNGLRFDTLDENIISIMKESGCQSIWIAPESGSERTLKYIIKKPLNLQKAKEIVKLCVKFDIRVGCFFVIGFPGETVADIQQTFKYIEELENLGIYRYEISFAAPIPGTELYDICLKNNYFTKEGKGLICSASTLKPVIRTADFTPRSLIRLRNTFTKKHYSLGERLYILFEDNYIVCGVLDLLVKPYQLLKNVVNRLKSK